MSTLLSQQVMEEKMGAIEEILEELILNMVISLPVSYTHLTLPTKA